MGDSDVDDTYMTFYQLLEEGSDVSKSSNFRSIDKAYLDEDAFDSASQHSFFPSKLPMNSCNAKHDDKNLLLDNILIVNPTYCILASKIIVVCHLYGTLHNFVNRGVEWLTISLKREVSQN